MAPTYFTIGSGGKLLACTGDRTFHSARSHPTGAHFTVWGGGGIGGGGWGLWERSKRFILSQMLPVDNRLQMNCNIIILHGWSLVRKSLNYHMINIY